jgi:formylglycine-generating enzyme required for sulfatase activity
MKNKDLFKLLLLGSLLMIAGYKLLANNIVISNVSLTGQNTVNHSCLVNFDISWENSWRNDISGAGYEVPYNRDAAWVFIKFRVSGGDWQHAYLDTAGHIAPPGSVIETGLIDPGQPFEPVSNPGMGVFIYRAANGSGTFSLTEVRLTWNYGVCGVGDNEVVDLRILAIEHVFIPQGTFYLGTGGDEPSAFYTYPDLTVPYLVTGEDEIVVGQQAGNLYYEASYAGGDQAGPVPAGFPKGYRAFYCQKYEISQQQYVNFLNTLTQQQASARKYSGGGYRYSITGSKVGQYSTSRPYVACSNLNWADITAYFDWSGLRPITEMEYEKACRGTLAPVPKEFAWGTSTVANHVYTLSDNGEASENIFSNYSTTVGNAAHSQTTPLNGPVNGPLRVGIFAANPENTGRISAGASYYGVMELSGNLLEHFVSAGHPIGRAFTALHGDGNLTATGYADVQNWPGSNSAGAGFRGSYWSYTSSYMQVSDRYGAAGIDAVRYPTDGGRGGRSAASENK